MAPMEVQTVREAFVRKWGGMITVSINNVTAGVRFMKTTRSESEQV
eukprot:CAMPEP_0115258970 /NCGR_PEP_ID=MMETSP0270-20121206/47581_1 /TAXON_ID=71861 /ORGANISM="Scrippsiella trochoidea, Strain CCMP3099" /LENGTH=45 /DNA_ID= /DNA_START= /DNA_END= /DNA_ORIENTATION=